MNRIVLDLQYFAEEEAAAAAAPETAGESGAETAAETGAENAPVMAGDTLADGTKVPNARVAAALEKQMKRHPELRKVYGRGQANAPADGAGNQPTGKTIQERWDELKKGEFKDLYGADVKAAVNDRFKNQNDATQQLEAMQPMLQALMQKAGVESVEELSQMILDDDSLYEEAAEEAGMTVERYKEFKALQEEHDRRAAQDEQDREQAFWRDHFEHLAEQAEALKAKFPNFDLKAEIEGNETFRRLTAPGSGVSLEDAYYAIHRRELEPQLMAYGMNRARQQMGQTIQAQRQRPAEGAMQSRGQTAADMKLNPAAMTRKERDRIRNLVHRGGKITFD